MIEKQSSQLGLRDARDIAAELSELRSLLDRYSVKDLETEFAILFAGDGPSTNDLIEEHLSERQRDERLLKSFS